MYFGLSEDQVMLQDSVRRYLEDASALEHVRGFVAGDLSLAYKLHDGLMDLGVPFVLIPEAHGGLGMGVLEAALIQEMLGRHVSPTGFTSAYAIAVTGLREAASDAEQGEWFGRMASGEVIFGTGLTERVGAREGAGVTLDIAAKVLEAGKVSKASGRASFVMGAEIATHFMLIADDNLIIVARDSEGLSETALTTIDKTRYEVTLDLKNVDCVLLDGDGSRDGTSDDLSAQAKMLDVGRVLLAADSLGAAEMMFEKSVTYSKEREQFNRPIGSFQAVKHMCADMAARLEPCRSLVWYAAYAQDHVPDEAALMSRLSKAHLAEVGKFIARTATEVHGGMGFTDLLGLHYWFKRIGANRQILGGPETVRAEAAAVQGWSQTGSG